MNHSPSAPPVDGNFPPSQHPPAGAPPQPYPGQPPQGYMSQQPCPGQPGLPYPSQPGVPGPYPMAPGQPYPPPPSQPYQPLYPNLPPPDYKDPGVVYPVPSPNEPPPPYQPPTLPNRPAPPIPQQPEMPMSWLNYQETPMPPGVDLVWSGCEGVQIYFIQPDGHVVSPEGLPIKIDFYARGRGSMRENDVVAVIDIKRVWRLKITNTSCFVVKGKYEDLAFLDHSTHPSTDRVVVLHFPAKVNQEERSKFERFVTQHSKVYIESQDMVTKLTMGVSNAYNTVTHKVNTVVKENAPDAHKSSKSIRKGAGSMVKLGGNLLSKGLNYAADMSGMKADSSKASTSPEHTQILTSLATLEKALEAQAVTKVQLQNV